MDSIRKFVRARAGATTIEYGLIVAGIALVALVAVRTVGADLKTKFTAARDALDPDITSSIRVRETPQK
jgi:pilus assembly protein Flp/PilA